MVKDADSVSVTEPADSSKIQPSVGVLSDKKFLVDRLLHALERMSRHNRGVAVFFVYINSANMTLGADQHQSMALTPTVAIVERLRSFLRFSDTIASWGPNKFVILCEDTTSIDQVRSIAKRLMESLSIPLLLEGVPYKADVLVGAATTDNRLCMPNELLQDAEEALQTAMDREPGVCELVEESISTKNRSTIRIEQELEGAISAKQLELLYQPIIDLKTGKTCGVEALVRWNHPIHGTVLPDEFLPIAEKSGAIFSIGSWVLNQVCQQSHNWSLGKAEKLKSAAKAKTQKPTTKSTTKTGLDNATANNTATGKGKWFQLSINLSERQIKADDLFETVKNVVTSGQKGLPEEIVLCLETKEAALAGSTPEMLEQLEELGVILAVDDFGVGWSSLSYLERFPVKIIKMDNSLISSLGNSVEDNIVANGVVSLAHSLGLKVIGEGVERESQAVALLEMGAEAAQGYYFARPERSAAVSNFITQTFKIKDPN
ncbi:MAG: GGDEF domain-containing phosphodiesterase [Actinobacteria bacterium]|nr:GGDEF domain-containing phosphodiesterase [Actinomycetota bacterium]MCL6104601.1 GGDEF domain-containing phosphodiesterase [Actinomycetota bacterium]